jgi:hypothetical protein
LGVFFAQAVVEQSKSKKKEADFACKKLPPPTPDGREGRLFPPEQSLKTLRLLNELPAGGNKFLYEIFTFFGRRPGVAKKSDELEEINDVARPGGAIGGAKSLARSGCATARRGL